MENILFTFVYEKIYFINIIYKFLMNRKIISAFSTAKDTCLKQLHIDNKGKIVDFAGKNFCI